MKMNFIGNGMKMHEVYKNISSTNGRYGVSIISEQENVTFPAEGSIELICIIAEIVVFKFIPGNTNTWVHVLGDVEVIGGATKVYKTFTIPPPLSPPIPSLAIPMFQPGYPQHLPSYPSAGNHPQQQEYQGYHPQQPGYQPPTLYPSSTPPNDYCTILLMGENAVIQIYEYKKRSSRVVVYIRGVAYDIPTSIVATMGLVQVGGHIVDITQPPKLPSEVVEALDGIKLNKN